MTTSIKALEQYRALQAFERNCERLHFEILMNTPRRHLDVLLELLRTLLPLCGSNQLVAAYGKRVDRLERIVAGRHNLRLAGGNTP